MSTGYKQDLPPRGGYGPIEWARKIPQRSRFGGLGIFGAFGAVTLFGWTCYYFERQRIRRDDIEMNDARLAMEPLFRAEQRRNFLRQLRKNRDEENELMKDVKGWQTGTLFGEKVFNGDAGRFPGVACEEFYAHVDYWDMADRVFERRKH